MKHYPFFLILFFIHTPALVLNAQDSSTILQYKDHVYKNNIKTVQLRTTNFELSQPLISLSGHEALILSFDDLTTEIEDYSYTFIHCNANWEPSGLISSECIDGFFENHITDYSFSTNTFQKYVHYKAQFPNNATRFIKSGNYLLKVYQDNDPENIVLTKRMMIYDWKVGISGNVHPASIIEERDYKQEIDFTIDYNGYTINNPYADLQVFIIQNNHWSNIRSGLKPLYARDQQLIYDFDDKNVFDGINEFRNFDIKTLQYKTPYVASIKKHDNGTHVLLFADQKRAFKQYFYQQDINGNFIIKNEDIKINNHDTDADYCYVSFYLPGEFYTEGDIYVYGAFNGWDCTTENKMNYNIERNGYECTLYLKQGYYNYEYVLLNKNKEIDESFIEGNHAETENDYLIMVFYRGPGTFYDQLIGVKRLSSTKN